MIFSKSVEKKEIEIPKMMCVHCKKRVETALLGIDGVKSVKINLEAKTAAISLSKHIEDSVITDALMSAGYETGKINQL